MANPIIQHHRRGYFAPSSDFAVERLPDGRERLHLTASARARLGEGFTPPVASPTGACCISTACSILTESACLAAGGTYLGDNSDCDPNPCEGDSCPPVNPCTVDVSWEAYYRNGGGVISHISRTLTGKSVTGDCSTYDGDGWLACSFEAGVGTVTCQNFLQQRIVDPPMTFDFGWNIERYLGDIDYSDGWWLFPSLNIANPTSCSLFANPSIYPLFAVFMGADDSIFASDLHFNIPMCADICTTGSPDECHDDAGFPFTGSLDITFHPC